ncbi:MAG TPA: glycosyltransferase family A protein [Rickettsiales bacterium]|nr:glycosyltransferase family A protein [Rickettsiales bacterium]
MKTGLVSIIIPTRNRVAFLQQALDSVYAQSYRDFEVIVVDDGSQDNTRELVMLYDSRLRYFTQAHSGAAAARNFGIREARGEFIAFLDDDDLFAPQKLQRCIAYLQAHPDVAWLCSGFAFIGESRNSLPRSPIIPAKPAMTLHDIAMFPLIHTSSVVTRAQNLAATKGFPEDFTVSEDYALWAELLQHGKGAALPEILTCFRRHKGNTTLSSQALMKANTAIIDTILKTQAPGLMSRDYYIQNLRRIVAEGLLHRREYLQYALFRLREEC